MNLSEQVPPEDIAYLRRIQEELRQLQIAVLRAEGAVVSEMRRQRERYQVASGEAATLAKNGTGTGA